MKKNKLDKKDPKKKKTYPAKLGGEETVSELRAHERLVHEDKDPIYPPDPIIEKPQKKIVKKIETL